MFTMADHFLRMARAGGAQDPFPERYTSMGLLAGQTNSATLPMSVTQSPIGIGVCRRRWSPRTCVAILDVLSLGRSMLGFGAGWYEWEHTALGMAFPPR